MSSAVTTRGSADFGATVRGVLFSPGSGFVSALKRVETRAEGISTYLLAGLGGAGAMLLWLKLGGLIGLREVRAADFGWGVFLSTLVLSGIVAMLAQVTWSFAAPRAAGPDAGSPRSFRAVWALSTFPQIPALLLLLPLDLIVVGVEAFTTDNVGDSVSNAWMALSTAFAVSLGAWSAYVFYKGTHAAARASTERTAAVTGLAVVCTVVVLAVLGAALFALREVAA